MATDRDRLFFGGQLRLRRLAEGLSLTELARRVHYSKGHLSKVETGQKTATPELARLVDANLNASGRLVALLAGTPGPGGETVALARRDVLTLGSTVLIAGLDLPVRPAVAPALPTRRAQALARTPRVPASAALREGQGHALAGDYYRFRTVMDYATSVMEHVDQAREEGPLGSAVVVDPVRAASGWSLYDLGRPAEGAAILDGEIKRIPARAARAYSRYAVRCALEHATAGELDRACDLSEALLGHIDAVASATIRYDVRKLTATLGRWRGHRRVGPLLRELNISLQTAAASD